MCHLGMVKITTNVSHGACQIAVMYVSGNYSCDGWSESRGAEAGGIYIPIWGDNLGIGLMQLPNNEVKN